MTCIKRPNIVFELAGKQENKLNANKNDCLIEYTTPRVDIKTLLER